MPHDWREDLSDYASRNRDNLYFDDKNFAYHWYKYGEEHKDQFFINFMVEWMAFNWLYQNPHQKSERKSIEEFYRGQGVVFDAFSLPQVDIIMKCPIHDMSAHDSETYRNSCEINEKNHRIITARLNSYIDGKKITQEDQEAALLQILFSVWCNLFHGSKSLYDPNDIELVRAAGIILHKYLETLIKTGRLSRL